MASYITTQGTTLKIGNGASPEVFTAIPQIVSIDGPSSSNEEIDVTHLGSVKREYTAAIPDAGELNCEIEWDERDTVHAGLRTKFSAATTHNFQLVDAGSPMKTASFSGFIKSLPQTYNIDDVVRSSMVIRITGDFTVA